MTTRATSDGTFEQDVLQAQGPVLVDFWAEWCGPCKMIAPLLDEVADKYEDKLDVVKLNVDENPNTAQKFGIRSIPTLILFKNGVVEAQHVPAHPWRASRPVGAPVGPSGHERGVDDR